MDTLELNKWAAAILGSWLFLMVINEVGNLLVNPVELEQSVLAIDVASAEADEGKAEAVEEGPSLVELMASADPARGEKVAKKCAACHTFEDGGKNKIGPALYGVLGRAKASAAGFEFSGALQELGGDWSYADLDAFLANPKGYAKGTKMAFAGIKKASDRAHLIAYMRQQHASPPALPSE